MCNDSNTTNSQSKADALTLSQRQTKKQLKSEVKFLRKVQKLETRIRQAITRKDTVVEQSARDELKLLWSTREKVGGGQSRCGSLIQLHEQQFPLSVTRQDVGLKPIDPRHKSALDEAVAIFRKLHFAFDEKETLERVNQLDLSGTGFREKVKTAEIVEQQQLNGNIVPDTGNAIHDNAKTIVKEKIENKISKHERSHEIDKQEQNQKARNLLQHMTKGTQTASMFNDNGALRGYARQKFHVRAALIIESFSKLSPEALASASFSTRHSEIMSQCWEKLGKIQRVCSIGCGPGNDVVGLIAFLQNYFNNDKSTGMRDTSNEILNDQCYDEKEYPLLQEILLLDFAINNWKGAVLEDLIPILVPHYVQKITCGTCDVTLSLLNDAQQLNSNLKEDGYHGYPSTGGNDSIAKTIQNTDIFLTSYLLTETRNQWDRFFIELVQHAKVGALFYFAEPMPWQLHRLMRMTSSSNDIDAGSLITHAVYPSPLHQLHFVWLDSSMQFPELQSLDGRVGGPAVLMAIKI